VVFTHFVRPRDRVPSRRCYCPRLVPARLRHGFG
jgi:hypothetical protein